MFDSFKRFADAALEAAVRGNDPDIRNQCQALLRAYAEFREGVGMSYPVRQEPIPEVWVGIQAD